MSDAASSERRRYPEELQHVLLNALEAQPQPHVAQPRGVRAVEWGDLDRDDFGAQPRAAPQDAPILPVRPEAHGHAGAHGHDRAHQPPPEGRPHPRSLRTG
ncbi:hypothetical protein Drose_15230 [Dactylosporangium roseum]|uniref:Uncharacterized protein n=1 Tax=Dactylosporangium roseum TaxID=47989 RepID=A0ABY5ZET4_9ACTN|nr:hypothetical protein [Dactylosporangium roseum]UWZ39465.1 hypothetical protein Drose_15230 [Dactylosporangium roseum]